jgi:hypothetical protein
VAIPRGTADAQLPGMGPSSKPRRALWCTIATVFLFATPRAAAAEVIEPIAVGEGALTEEAQAKTAEALRTAIAGFDPGGVHLQLSLYLRGPGVLDAALLVTGRDGSILGGFTVRSSGRGTPELLLIRAAVDRLISDAAVAFSWPRKR